MNLNNTSSKTLWIGEIDSWMDEKFLIKVFSEYANVKNIKVIRDKVSGTNQGYGFVEFESPEVASYILDNCNGCLIPNSNKTFKLNWATFSAGKMHALLGGSVNSQEYTIYVCDLDLNVSEEMLKEIFEKLYPSVVSSKLIVDPISKISKGYGFVKFQDYNESQKAIIEMNGKYIFSKPIKTNQAVWKKYNPESIKTNPNNLQKTYQNNYYNNKSSNNNSNYTNQQQSYYYNQFNNNNNNVTYMTPTPVSVPPSTSTLSNQNGLQPGTQNINIYLQSLYQQHYLNNVYLNQFLNGNSTLTQQFSNLNIVENNEKIDGLEFNNDATTESYNKNESFITNNPIDSTINTEGK
jgi:RNA recognition motif-containing protein